MKFREARIVALACLVIAMAVGGAARAQTILDLDFEDGQLPTVAEPNLVFHSQCGVLPEASMVSVSSGVLEIRGTAEWAGEGGPCGFGGCAWYQLAQPSLDPARPVIAEFRVRAVRVLGPGRGPVWFWIHVQGLPVAQMVINLGPESDPTPDSTELFVVDDYVNIGPSSTSFVTFRMEAYPDGVLKVYQDNALIWEGSPGPAPNDPAFEGIVFGDGNCGGLPSTRAPGDCDWEFVRVWQPVSAIELDPLAACVLPGGVLEYDIAVENLTMDPVTQDVWIDAYLPNGAPYSGNPILGPRTITLGSLRRVQRTLRLRIPNGAPSPFGPVILRANMGSFGPGDDVFDQFPFSVK